MRSVLNNLTWILFAIFALPTILVLGSWNSLPGEPMYGVKLGMEQALLVLVSPSFQARGDLSIKYTERRFSENKRLFADKGSAEGLTYLDKQVVATKDVIVKGNDAKEQALLAQAYIDTLKDVSAQLETQKQSIASGVTPLAGGDRPVLTTAISTPTIPSTPTPARAPFVSTPTRAPYATPTPTHAPTSMPVPTHAPTPIPVPQQEQQNTIDQINETQENIKKTINELESVAQSAGAGGRQEGKKGNETPKEDVKEQNRDDREKGKRKN